MLPGVPTIGESLPGFAAVSWSGTCAPKATPPAIIATLSSTITTGFADPQFKARIKDIGGEAVATPAQDFAKFISEETNKWAEVIEFAGVKTE